MTDTATAVDTCEHQNFEAFADGTVLCYGCVEVFGDTEPIPADIRQDARRRTIDLRIKARRERDTACCDTAHDPEAPHYFRGRGLA